VQAAAMGAVVRGGRAAATPEVLTALLWLLGDSDEHVRCAAAWALEGLGDAAATPEFLAFLAGLLGDPHKHIHVRSVAAKAVASLGEKAANRPEFLLALSQMLRDKSWLCSETMPAIRAMTRCGVRFVERNCDITPQWLEDLEECNRA